MLTFSSAARKHEVSPVGYLLFPRPKEAKRYLLQPDYKGHRAHLHPGLASAEPERKSQQPFTKLPSITETKTEPLRSRRLFTLVALRRPTGWLLKWDGGGWGWADTACFRLWRQLCTWDGINASYFPSFISRNIQEIKRKCVPSSLI